nr:RNA-directed DNA polymerase, eukaryota [Tanacetum cinerariifolium]
MVTMGNLRSKEDDVQNISTLVFVTNFPEQFGAKDLWHSCKAYGHVVDAYIPDRRSKAGNKEPMDNTPTMALDETCLNNEVYSLSLLGKVKEFMSLTNLKLVLAKEGFPRIEIKYMGGYWVMIVFQDEETKNRFQSNVAMGYWFSQIIKAHNDFILEERVVWVEIKGIPCKWWSKNTFRRIASRWGTLLNGDELEEGGLYSNRLCVCTKMKTVLMESFKMVYGGKSEPQSEDPFGIYEALKKKVNVCNNGSISEESRKYPPGFTPKDVVDSPVNDQDDVLENSSIRNGKEDGGSVEKQSGDKNARCTDTYESMCSGHFKKSGAPRTGGSIVQLMDELVTVGQTMGYDMTETKMKSIDLWGIKRCWGNFDFNYVYSEAVGIWLLSGKRLLVISVYAPQELRDKKMLWDYLVMVICNWDGEVVAMGDFNEVRDCSERFGSVFKKKGAEVFNNFIATAGLVEVPIGGCSFTWCHKSATKMSKLDRFLISDNLMCTCPTISSISLDRYLSDRRPILMREIHCDYGPIPFKFFHYWCEIDGFDKLVEDSWNEANICDQNDYINLMKKLRFLKEKIRKWNYVYKESKKCGTRNLKVELNSLYSVIDKGDSTYLVKDALESEVTNDEVRKAVWDCGVDKTPGPDSFTFGFYRRYWKLIERDVIKAVKWFFLHGSIPNGVLGDLVNEIQSAFVADRQILDGPFILNEIVQWCKKRNKQAMVFKVDFEKAYDSVGWDFVEDSLRKFGFGDKWCTWIRSCLQSSRCSVIVNGSRVLGEWLWESWGVAGSGVVSGNGGKKGLEVGGKHCTLHSVSNIKDREDVLLDDL